MPTLFIIIGFVSVILFLNNFISILKKIKIDQPTTLNTLICTITALCIFYCLIIF